MEPGVKIYLTAHWTTGAAPTYQYVGTDKFEYSPVLTNYSDAVNYTKEHELKKQTES